MKLKQISLPHAPKAGSVLNTTYLAIEFIRRMEAYAVANGITINGSGYRDISVQARYWVNYQTDPAHHNPSAYPGQSWHNCGLAYDVARIGNDPDGTGRYPATMEADFLVPPEKQELYKYGLCIPMWKETVEKENWHIIPIECLGIAGVDRQFFLDEDDLLNSSSGYRVLRNIALDDWTGDRIWFKGNDVKRFQRAVGIKEDGYYGDDSEKAAKDLQTKNKLTVDGLVGPKTWQVVKTMLQPVAPDPEPDYKLLYETAMMELDETKESVQGLTDSLKHETETSDKLRAILQQFSNAVDVILNIQDDWANKQSAVD